MWICVSKLGSRHNTWTSYRFWTYYHSLVGFNAINVKLPVKAKPIHCGLGPCARNARFRPSIAPSLNRGLCMLIMKNQFERKPAFDWIHTITVITPNTCSDLVLWPDQWNNRSIGKNSLCCHDSAEIKCCWLHLALNWYSLIENVMEGTISWNSWRL